MNTTRQDAWSKDEDIMLAETVLRYIREGNTQLEAFKEVAKKLSRTSAACGFRWNATIRKKYHNAIQFAKEERKQGVLNKSESHVNMDKMSINDPIDTAILLLRKLKFSSSDQDEVVQTEQEETIKHLKKENQYLKGQLVRYDDAWVEMGKLWEWVKKENCNQ